MPTKEQLIAHFELAPLPVEGGFFRETHRNAHSTAIYYLLTAETCSLFHRLTGDEVYHFYLGDPVDLHLLRANGVLEIVRLGSDLAGGEFPQAVVPAGVWQGSRLAPDGEWALLGTTVHPGFEYTDLRLADASLLERFPQHESTLRPLWPR